MENEKQKKPMGLFTKILVGLGVIFICMMKRQIPPTIMMNMMVRPTIGTKA